MSTNLLSMTGFGRARALLGDRTVTVEVRSLNHRGLDIKLRPHDLQLAPEIEIEAFRLVRGSVARGSIAIVVRDEASEGQTADPDLERLSRAYQTLEQLRRGLGLSEPVNLTTAATFLAATRASHGREITMAEWPALSPALTAAMASLRQMRANEGTAMGADLASRLSNLRALAGKIAALVMAVPDRAARRLEERLASLLGPNSVVDPARLAQEVAMLAERLDVSEEVARLHAHLDHFASLLEGASEAPGRRMDFLAQEIGRELNTLGGKIQDSSVAALVIDAKAELEKLREQVQNIE